MAKTPVKGRASKKSAPIAQEISEKGLPMSDHPRLSVVKPKAIQIYQIHYRKDQVKALDSAFIDYNNQGVEAETHEFYVFQKLTQAPAVRAAQYWGAVSWRFGEKTGMKGKELISIIEKNQKSGCVFHESLSL